MSAAVLLSHHCDTSDVVYEFSGLDYLHMRYVCVFLGIYLLLNDYLIFFNIQYISRLIFSTNAIISRYN